MCCGPDAIWIVPVWHCALDAECKRWLQTPYGKGQASRGRAADCAGFIEGTLDALFKIKPGASPLRAGVIEAGAEGMRWLLARYPHVSVGSDQVLEPGDVVVTRERGGNRHILLVGVMPGELWHSYPGSGVCRTSIDAWGSSIVAVYRLDGREEWR